MRKDSQNEDVIHRVNQWIESVRNWLIEAIGKPMRQN